MNGEFALLIALCTYGNAVLEGTPQASTLSDSGPVMRYIRSVRWAGDPPGEIELVRRAPAQGVTAFWDDLRKRGARRMLIVRLPIHTTVADLAFAGKGPWAIQVNFQKSSEVWVAEWTAGADRDRPWQVNTIATACAPRGTIHCDRSGAIAQSSAVGRGAIRPHPS